MFYLSCAAQSCLTFVKLHTQSYIPRLLNKEPHSFKILCDLQNQYCPLFCTPSLPSTLHNELCTGPRPRQVNPAYSMSVRRTLLSGTELLLSIYIWAYILFSKMLHTHGLTCFLKQISADSVVAPWVKVLIPLLASERPGCVPDAPLLTQLLLMHIGKHWEGVRVFNLLPLTGEGLMWFQAPDCGLFHPL